MKTKMVISLKGHSTSRHTERVLTDRGVASPWAGQGRSWRGPRPTTCMTSLKCHWGHCTRWSGIASTPAITSITSTDSLGGWPCGHWQWSTQLSCVHIFGWFHAQGRNVKVTRAEMWWVMDAGHKESQWVGWRGGTLSRPMGMVHSKYEDAAPFGGHIIFLTGGTWTRVTERNCLFQSHCDRVLKSATQPHFWWTTQEEEVCRPDTPLHTKWPRLTSQPIFFLFLSFIPTCNFTNWNSVTSNTHFVPLYSHRMPHYCYW